MIDLFMVVAAASLASGCGPQQDCVGSTSAPALDHVVLVVRDLDRASAAFRADGFRLKQGRLHANNLLNRHVKFRDGSSIELMTVRGEPGDAMARGYASLAADGEGGVYGALRVDSIAAPERAAAALGLAPDRSSSGAWRFIGFPPASAAAAVFFSSGVGTVQDPDSLVSHRPDVLGLDEVWLEGGGDLERLLEQLGAKRCGTERAPDGRLGTRYGLSRGRIVVAPGTGGRRPRVLGVVLRCPACDEPMVSWPHPRFWVRRGAI